MIKPSRALIAAGVVFAVIVAVLVAVTVVAVQRKLDEPEPRPTLNASVGTLGESVPPIRFCADLATGRCDPDREPIKMAVRPGAALVISLPEYVTARPWSVTIQRFDTRRGVESRETTTNPRPTKGTLVLKSTDDLLLSAVEISVPSPVQDSFGNLISQAVWGIDTLDVGAVPDGAAAPATAPPAG